ncbi:MAG: hypothetical protein J6K45_04985 [Clostridia bacterium]|nr:hypothetical protein [Clostridia bacterium]
MEEIAIALGIINIILWVITWIIYAESQKIQDEYNKLFSNEIYELKKEETVNEFKSKLKRIREKE